MKVSVFLTTAFSLRGFLVSAIECLSDYTVIYKKCQKTRYREFITVHVANGRCSFDIIICWVPSII